MSLVFPWFGHKLLKELNVKWRFSDTQKSSQSLPRALSKLFLLLKTWVPPPLLHLSPALSSGPPSSCGVWLTGAASSVLYTDAGCRVQRLLSPDFRRSVSQNSSVLREEEDEHSCSESETQLSQRPSAQHLEEVIPVSVSWTLDGRYFRPACLSRSICFHSLPGTSELSSRQQPRFPSIHPSSVDRACVACQALFCTLRTVAVSRRQKSWPLWRRQS